MLENISSPDIHNKIIQTTVCNCTKSRCLKKYCECFKVNIRCGNLCRCYECLNKDRYINTNNENININNIINENDEENIIIKNNYIETLKEICKTYDINAFDIYIKNQKLIIEDRYVDLTNNKININTTPKLTNKKRSRTKNENSSNIKTCPTTNSNSRRTRRNYTQVNSNIKTKKLVMN